MNMLDNSNLNQSIFSFVSLQLRDDKYVYPFSDEYYTDLTFMCIFEIINCNTIDSKTVMNKLINWRKQNHHLECKSFEAYILRKYIT